VAAADLAVRVLPHHLNRGTSAPAAAVHTLGEDGALQGHKRRLVRRRRGQDVHRGRSQPLRRRRRVEVPLRQRRPMREHRHRGCRGQHGGRRAALI
jgi:hypothetical protein